VQLDREALAAFCRSGEESPHENEQSHAFQIFPFF
jgi:hypothetical protein